MIFFSAVAVIIFRFELAIFLGCIILIEIVKKNISIYSVMKIGIISSILALLTTVTVDSVFWNRTVWPEGEVFWFNAILNKSSNWGVSPFFWYWYSAVPRALGCSITLLPFGDRNTKLLMCPALIFITIMSFLPHKELRFIIYTFPLFNISAALICNKVWVNRHKSMSRWLCSIYIVLHLLGNVFLSCMLLKIASENYPGGEAISRLHKIVPPETEVHIYIDNLSAQTGVSRFTQVNANWIYNKTENIPSGSEDYYRFTHLLLEAKSKYSPNLKPYLNSHEILDVIEGFSHIHFNYNSFPPFKIKSKPMIFILKRNYIPNIQLKVDTPKNTSLPLKKHLNPNKTKSLHLHEDNSTQNDSHKVNNLDDDTKEFNKDPERAIKANEFPTLSKLIEMTVDDFFEDLKENSVEKNVVKIVNSINKIVKLSTVKEKKNKQL